MKKGFTLTEVIVMLVVLAFLLGFTVPKFMTLVHKAKEGRTKHQLVQMRSAIAAYYGEHQGMYPTDDLSCLVPAYIEKIPQVTVPGYAPTSHVSTGTYEEAFTKTGGWAYVNNPEDPRFGDVFVNVDEHDSYGKHWTTH
ncbi:MAG: type II secretion system protein [Elusimicrobiaceae bacterium]|nr:type II secretion system protein [Elusimicrobiaceae bacterium]MBP5617446.1 type II secretion system protein [Elusimicrobiaceae bacterium]